MSILQPRLLNNGVHNWPSIQTIQYLGSKARLVSEICPLLLQDSPHSVVDLFAGTGTIAYALKGYTQVYANDVQRYSYTILDAILNGSNLPPHDIDAVFLNANANYEKLLEYYSEAVELERRHLLTEGESWVDSYSDFCAGTPHVYAKESHLECFRQSRDLLQRIVPGVQPGQGVPPCLFTAYYANTYFGLSQCMEIDAMRGAIACVRDEAARNVLLTALMSAMSISASTTTHFAQYLRVKDTNTARFLAAKRSQPIIPLVRERLRAYAELGLTNHRLSPPLHCGNADYLDFLAQAPLDDGVVVYADPPYFKEHYSRYYHVLETLCLYDYPELTFNKRIDDVTVGRYRVTRNSSPFGRKASALGGFENLVKACSEKSSAIAISYSENSIVSIKDIISTASAYYDVKVSEFRLNHSSQGRADSTKTVTEVLLMGTPKKSPMARGHGKVTQLLQRLSDIRPTSDSPAAAMHNYMARKPHNVVSAIIRGLLDSPGLVLDPFAGSGTTAMEARHLGHKSISIDLSRQAQMIMEVSLESWNLDFVKRTLLSFLERVRPSIEPLYFLDGCGIDSALLERCHFDLDEQGALVPVSFWARRKTSTGWGPRTKAAVTDCFVKLYRDLSRKAEGAIADLDLIPNARIAVQQGAKVADYFCARNRLAVAALLNALDSVHDAKERLLLEFLVSSSLNLIRLSDKKASSQIPYWRPKSGITSRNAWLILNGKADLILKGLAYLKAYAPGNLVRSFEELVEPSLSGVGALVIKAGSQSVGPDLVPDGVVDLVVTDPPYTDQVPYLEYSQLWARLLGWDTLEPATLEKELVVTDAPSRPCKRLDDYLSLFGSCLAQVSRMMKHGAFLVMFFHDFSLVAWSRVILAAHQAGLAYEAQVRLGRERRSFKTVLSPDRTLNGDYLLIFRKRECTLPCFEGTLEEAENQVVRKSMALAQSMEGKTTAQDLYDRGVLQEAIETGAIHLLSLHHRTLLDVLKKKRVWNRGKWVI